MKKLLVVGVIVLFLGVSVIPSTGTTDVKQVTILTISGNILYVGGNGTGNYSNIQDAIDDASDGDTVFVYNGTYYENVEVDKSINLLADGIILKSFTLVGEGIGYSGYGIQINSDNNFIKNTCIKNNDYGIFSRSYQNNTFIGNLIIENWDGISIEESYENNFLRNYFMNFYHQLHLASSEDNIISNNTFYSDITRNLWEGLNIVADNRDVITHNSFYNCGLELCAGTHNSIVFNNTVNEKPLLYLEEVSDIKIEEDVGQVILKNCYNVTVRKQKIINVSTGIELHDSDNCIITDNIIKNTSVGIDLRFSHNTIISKNNISFSKQPFINAISHNGIIVENNISNGSRVGVSFSENVSIRNNRIFNMDYIALSLVGIDNSIISNNSIYNNERGIELDYFSENNVILNNDIKQNLRFGICISDGANNNKILCNNFFRNLRNAYFIQNLSNTWDGNYWNRLRLLPKIIFGFKNENSIFPTMFDIDWHPA